MPYRLAADLVVLIHLSFVLFVLLGGLFVLRWPRVMWLHLPAAAWGAFIEFSGWICPLTPLENWLRTQGGSHGYEGDFVVHYVIPLLYPETLTHDIQLILGAIVVTVNLAIYGWWWRTQQR
ncbi:DUF2784 domain-containing protein [Nitrospira sp. NS4]|uniref:DUF2784 domain-containing protein n=1 Tax=Nitrospira sp. NS4 TaxID=3414498 RepID=UPI003C2C6FCF